jgi:general secretion pathway protein A
MMIDLRACFGLRSIPFTREIRPEDHLDLPFFEEARMSCALIAPAGTGKTQLLRRLKVDLPEARYRTTYVKVTGLSKRDMCREIAAACGTSPAGSYPILVRKLQERFDSTSAQDGLRPVLILDEGHDFRPDVLSMLRILTNFDMDSRLVLSVVLAGQGALRTMLARDDQEALARRIVHYSQLRLLTREELGQYVAHRCALAGAAKALFDDRAIDALFEMGRGNLRATDALAYKALEHAAIAKQPAVAVPHLVAARRDVFA